MRSPILGTLLAVLPTFNIAIAGCGESEGHSGRLHINFFL